MFGSRSLHIFYQRHSSGEVSARLGQGGGIQFGQMILGGRTDEQTDHYWAPAEQDNNNEQKCKINEILSRTNFQPFLKSVKKNTNTKQRNTDL